VIKGDANGRRGKATSRPSIKLTPMESNGPQMTTTMTSLGSNFADIKSASNKKYKYFLLGAVIFYSSIHLNIL